ncbi:hypothetical protein HPP92_025888 [Vanilla planifolia]|uniref:Plant heme peroxidase family profile domain-containing protein n=1 Tax=Vanilla planifolia TaxID=51239 RepID=A0A835U891_VANPL|nr:hypothetical protein HPP92_025888 [Vanilla planifolia]
MKGCDASVIISSNATNKAEKDHADNLSLAGDGFDTVIKAKAAVDAVPSCRNKVSCADVLAMATRDVISLAGGPSYAVELGRLDGLVSTAASVGGKLPQPNFNVNQLTSLFASNGLSQTDMIALSGKNTGLDRLGHFLFTLLLIVYFIVVQRHTRWVFRTAQGLRTGSTTSAAEAERWTRV